MSTDERIVALMNGESLALEVGTIEAELAQFWKKGEEKGYTRACTATLLVYAPDEGAYERAAQVFAALVRHRPCRIVALMAAPEANENTLAAYLTAHIHDAEGNKSGCEQITLMARGNAVEHLAETALPFLIEKLPVTLWWQGDLPEENVLFEKLLNVSQRLIFDSGDGHDVGNTLSQARALGLYWKNGVGGDLTWQRLAPWRELVTKFMESAPAAALRHQVTEATLEANAAAEGDAHFAQPFLLLGWLAGLLNWKLNEPLTPLPVEPATGNTSVFRTGWQNKDKEVTGKIILRKLETDADPAPANGSLRAIQILFQPNEKPVVITMQRHLAAGQVTIRIHQGEQTLSESTANFSDTPVAELLAQEMMQDGRNTAYEGALRFATQLI